MNIQERDLREWAHHPVTQELLQDLKQAQQATMENWAAETYVSDKRDLTLQMNAKALGALSVTKQLIEIIEGRQKLAESAETLQ